MLKILLVTDHKSGHESISKGIVKYLQEKDKVTVVEIYSHIRAKFLKKIATFALNKIKLDAKNIKIFGKLFYKNLDLNLDLDYNLVISTGGDTSFLNILLAKYLNIPNIYCSSLRGLDNNLFTHIVSIKDNKISNEIVVAFPPIYMKRSKRELEGKYIAILIGGKTKNYPFGDEDFILLVQKSIALAKKYNYKVLITTSRRTPLNVEEEIKLICDKNRDTLQRYVLFNQNPEKVVNYFLSNADIVFCTEDSGSMITESILSERKTYTLKNKNSKPNKLYKNFIEQNKALKYIKSINIDEINTITFDEYFNKLEDAPAEKVISAIKNIL